LVLANEVLCIDPGMVLIIQFRTIFSFAKEYLSAAWVHFSILGDIIDFALKNSPAIVIGCMLRDLVHCIKDIIGIFDHVFDSLGFLHEFLQK
jgi:hypothetical protein